MNSGIIILDEDTPFFIYDTEHPEIQYFELSRADSRLVLVWDDESGVEQRTKLEHPLEPGFVAILEKYLAMGVGQGQDGEIQNSRVVPVVISKS